MISFGIVEDNSGIRNRILEFLKFYPEITVVLVAESGEQLQSSITSASTLPQVILMDIELPGITGIQTTAWLKERHPEIEILMFTVFEDDARIFESIQAGASGYLLKDTDIDDVVAALKELQQGGAPMTPHIARKVIQAMRVSVQPNRSQQTPPEEILTERERQIVQLIAQGKSNKEIGEVLFVSPLTVKTHIKNIYEKLHIHSRAEATSLAIKRGLA